MDVEKNNCFIVPELLKLVKRSPMYKKVLG